MDLPDEAFATKKRSGRPKKYNREVLLLLRLAIWRGERLHRDWQIGKLILLHPRPIHYQSSSFSDSQCGGGNNKDSSDGKLVRELFPDGEDADLLECAMAILITNRHLESMVDILKPYQEAAFLIQKQLRKCWAHKRNKLRRYRAHKRNKSATLIQNEIRGFLGRKEAKQRKPPTQTERVFKWFWKQRIWILILYYCLIYFVPQ